MSPHPITDNVQQAPAEVAVVLPTILRPDLLRSARSVFRQSGVARIHLLVGIDIALGDPGVLAQLRAERPEHVMLTVLDLGYSTSVRHGGVQPNAYSGSLRAILTLAANSRHVAYLDDNDWWAPTHLRRCLDAAEGKAWAFSGRWLVDPLSGWPICEDQWDSVGPGKGINAARFGGFVQPSGLLIDKHACAHAVHLWGYAAFADGGGEDRLVFDQLKRLTWGATGVHSCFCMLPEAALAHDHHAREFRQRKLDWLFDRTLQTKAEAQVEAAAQALRAGELEAAALAYRKALAIHRHIPEALGVGGQVLAACGDLEAAEALRGEADLLAFAAGP